MPTPIVICDDSSLARKQMAKALPAEWDIEINFACDGQQALEAIRQGLADLLFLDLNMPNMDGYQVLETIRREDLPTLVIVVSGDVQEEAYHKVSQLGALAFLPKPIDSQRVQQTLKDFGLTPALKTHAEPQTQMDLPTETNAYGFKLKEVMQEIVNVAMGQAASLFAQVLKVFIELPVPQVNILQASRLQNALSRVEQRGSISVACQGFTSMGIAGEALLLFRDASFTDLAKLTHYPNALDRAAELELLTDMASILIGACVKGLSEQLDLDFSKGHPVILGQHSSLQGIFRPHSETENQHILAIKIDYKISSHNIDCDLLLLFPEPSMRALEERLSYIVEGH
ncbi:Response regulator receiver domain-containing protein [Allopseudospirillum japonicum]|uniref:Response regulator receiver domain-containing protein n=1 Tax=Allopseudospirillum japonicum TaxID=64971 RepID=A0A1H6T5Y9_9GAMM|nr:response regulator [Allopseudospirillum japonicum]SEI75451.1 Response regulator receiver domain-containing protein [Allopseudospirillum japonicum]